MNPVFASVLTDVIAVMGVPVVSAGFWSAAAAAWAFLRGWPPAKASEWAVRGLAAGFLFGLGLSAFLAIELAQRS